MKTCKFLKNVLIAATLLLAASAAETQAQNPQITITNIPPTGEEGIAEGKVEWGKLTGEDPNQYAIIAILRATWNGGGGYFVKPYDYNYLNSIDASGSFFINIITGGVDATSPEVKFYLVERATFAGIAGGSVTPDMMIGKYLGEIVSINRSDPKWKAKSPEPSIRPGFVEAGTSITLSSQGDGVIRYTVDGSDPATSLSAKDYSSAFTVPSEGSLIVKAVTVIDGVYSEPTSMLWMPKEPYDTPLFGINVSLALNGESWGYNLSEKETAERMAPVASLAKWVRTFGTVGNGLPHINKIAKAAGMRTMIGVYITSEAGNNTEQLKGLREILQTSPAPDLIAVGNETIGTVSPSIIAACIDSVRKILKDHNLTVPVGSADIGGA
ncbi:MAG: chitobiase/beta-hexosaminidase C-terminal domain-containing protein, partial [Prevotellaceae bacterium]|nr:chitobiase/beta-hexosaminidase C-terminal domain-containing protein [Prevotellaceae bacterium]